MKVLLLGANGQLGSDIQRVFNKAHTIQLIPLTRKQLDISNIDLIYSALKEQKFDALINCTSYHKTDEVELHAEHAVKINAFAVREMAKACHAKKARFFHISTDYVFGANDKQIPLSETDLPAPLNVYGASKLMGEALARTFHDDTILFRVASLFGIAGASGKGGNFVETMIRLGKSEKSVRVVNDQWMSPTATLDIARILLQFLTMSGSSGLYHVVNTGQASWYEFAKTIFEMTGIHTNVIPVSSSEYSTVAMRPNYSVLNNKKISVVMNNSMRHWRDALGEYLGSRKYS